MEAIIVALIGACTTIIVAALAQVNKNAKQAAKNSQPVSNGFTRHVLDAFEEAKERDAELSKKLDDHLAWSREETERIWAAVVRSKE